MEKMIPGTAPFPGAWLSAIVERLSEQGSPSA